MEHMFFESSMTTLTSQLEDDEKELGVPAGTDTEEEGTEGAGSDSSPETGADEGLPEGFEEEFEGGPEV